MNEATHTNDGEAREDGAVQRDGAKLDVRGRDILDIEQAAELLGISVKTFIKVLHSEDMPGRKIGREWKFSRQALIDWVARGRSRDFYDRQDEETDDEVTPARPPTRERARRTAGWNIEYS
jgi:excisionase family DNA binding protein